jgi:hypothetical protein
MVLGLSSIASGPSKTASYFICHFSESVTQSHVNELKNNGFQIVQTDSQNQVVYVKGKSHSSFSKHLKSQMKELIKVGPNGQKTYIVESSNYRNPEFLKLFFNFI